MALRLLLFILALVVTHRAFSAQLVSWGLPRLTECRSPELQTFTCRWTNGNFSNLTGGVKVMFVPRSDLIWRECPDYKSAGENSCYFDSSYTSAGGGYCLRLVYENASLDEYCFELEDIFRPDPPIGLTWALVNLSLARGEANIQVGWKPPKAAGHPLDLLYELQYKDANESEWHQVGTANATTVAVDALRADREYEIRVRCRGLDSGNFGPFSEIHYVSFSRFSRGTSLGEPEFPWPLFIIFGTLSGAAVLLLIRFTKQRRFRPCGFGTFCTKRKFGQRDTGASY